MDFTVTDEVLFVGGRERAAHLARSLDGCLVRWADSPAAALALLEGREEEFACVVTDSVAVTDAVAERWTDVRVLSVDEDTSITEDERLEDLAKDVSAAIVGDTEYNFPVPINEEARLQDLQPYLREAVVSAGCFDRLASLAVRLLEGQIGFVGLVDERCEHVVGCAGDFPNEVVRDQTICTHTILDNGPLVVEDAAHDERFADSPLVRNYGIRAYAGVPVRGRLGEAIGVICVIDTIPRAFAPREVEMLRDLAEEATDQFELRRRIADEQGSEA